MLARGGWNCSRRCRIPPSAPAKNSPCRSPWARPSSPPRTGRRPRSRRPTRVRKSCAVQLGESPDLFPALWGLFLFHIARGEIRTGLDQGEQLLSLAQRAQDPALLLQAHHALGPTYALVGDWASARTHLEQGIAHYDPRQHRTHAFLYGGHDPCVCCLSFAAKSLWMLGYPEQALRRGREALALARELGHPTSLAHTQLSVVNPPSIPPGCVRDPGAGRGTPGARCRAGALVLPGGRIGPAGLGSG